MSFLDTMQLLSGLIVVLSAMIAAIWAYYRHVRLREAKKSLTLNIEPGIYPNGNSVMVEIIIRLTNTGTLPIFISDSSIKKCLIEIKEIAGHDSNHVYSWTDPAGVHLIEPTRYLGDYESAGGKNEPIILEPGVPCEVVGYVLFNTDYKGLIILQANFEDSEETIWRARKIIDTR